MTFRVSEAVKELRTALSMTQLQLAIKLDVGGHSVAHYENGRAPNGVTIARLCRIAHEAGRNDLADIFAAMVPGVKEGVLIPAWRLPKERQPDVTAWNRTLPNPTS